MKGKDDADFVFWQQRCNSSQIYTWRWNSECHVLHSSFGPFVQACCPCEVRNIKRLKVLFSLHDNACPHTAAIVQQFLAKKGVVQLSHLTYSPDLSPPLQCYETQFQAAKIRKKKSLVKYEIHLTEVYLYQTTLFHDWILDSHGSSSQMYLWK